MIDTSLPSKLKFSAKPAKFVPYLRYFFFGLLLPLGFAPFHMSGLAILSVALFYNSLTDKTPKSPFLSGIIFGLGFFGLGISWVYVSIHDYGHLHTIISALITLMFLLYLAIFPATVASIFCRLVSLNNPILSALLFSSLWIVSEYARTIFLSGFPWLLLGFSQFDAPTKFLMPIIGVFGAGFLTCFAGCLLSTCMQIQKPLRYLYLTGFVVILILPLLFKKVTWVEEDSHGILTGIIQTNLSMRDKWDDTLFWHLLRRYQQDIKSLLVDQQSASQLPAKLIVLPESAIPLPATYISDFLEKWDHQAKQADSAILLGIPQPATHDDSYYFNALIGIGKAKGFYRKQHLVPFGEYIPKLLQTTSDWLGIPPVNLKAGKRNQPLIMVNNHPIASLICYELGFGDLLRYQLPTAEWIVSISDDGWFGHSLAMYQQQQMAQVLSLETGRYQVLANNDGLSSIINTQGNIVASLPAFHSGILQATLFPATGQTPWVLLGDLPIVIFVILVILGYIVVTYLLQHTRDVILTNPIK